MWIIEDSPKLAVGHILDALKPRPLQSRIRDDLEFAHTHFRKDFLSFMDHVIQRAEMYSDYDEQVVTTPTKFSSQSSTASGKSNNTRGAISPQRASSNPAVSNKEYNHKTPPDCLNPSCHEKHNLKECKNTSQYRKDDLYAERAQARKASGDQRVTRADAAVNNTDPGSAAKFVAPTNRGNHGAKSVRANPFNPEGRIQISFASAQKYVALPDIGADDNTIPSSLLKELAAAGLFVARRTLENHITVSLAVNGPGISAIVKEQAQLTIDLHLSAGPPRLRSVKWFVTENDMDEVLLG